MKSSGWLVVNANTETHDQVEEQEQEDGGCIMEIDNFPYEEFSFDEELEYYAHYGDESEEQGPNDSEQPSKDDQDYNEQHTHILTTATKTAPLLHPTERHLLALIKFRKDEATLGYSSPSHSHKPYLGPPAFATPLPNN